MKYEITQDMTKSGLVMVLASYFSLLCVCDQSKTNYLSIWYF